jgi:hypothetical protein
MMRATRMLALGVVLATGCGKKDADPPPPTPPLPTPARAPTPTSTSTRAVMVVLPAQLKRIAGDEAIQPDADTAKAIVASGRSRRVTSWKVCIDPTGAVDDVEPIHSSGFLAWDARLAAGTNAWRFAPYLDGGTPVRVCTAETFAWTAK